MINLLIERSRLFASGRSQYHRVYLLKNELHVFEVMAYHSFLVKRNAFEDVQQENIFEMAVFAVKQKYISVTKTLF